MMPDLKQSFALCMAVLLAACSGNVVDDSPETPLTGERISVLTFDERLEADESVSSQRILLPPPYRNLNWTQMSGNAQKAMYHLSIGDVLRKQWSKRGGKGGDRDRKLTSSPIVVDGLVFVQDARATVFAYEAASGRQVWRSEFKIKDENNELGFGGGVAHGAGQLYVNNGYGVVRALEPKSGRELWRYEIGIPFRAPPSYSNGRVFVVTHDNQLIALAAEDGVELWNHVGIAETAGIISAASPSVAEGVVVAPYSSGELFALRVENGRVAWTDTLSRAGRLTALASLNDIDGGAVVDRGTVYALSHSGRMVAIDYSTGGRVWEANVGGLSTPWIGGDYIYVLTDEAQVVCLLRRNGQIRWVTQLQRFEDPKDREDVIFWVGPVLASDRLIIGSSTGYLVSVSPYTGDILSGRDIGKGIAVSPVVANETLFVLQDDGRLSAYR
ncbi:MAG: PQQ-binding-like beta-propeller repeat protein [Pseudomonadota bacterium]